MYWCFCCYLSVCLFRNSQVIIFGALLPALLASFWFMSFLEEIQLVLLETPKVFEQYRLPSTPVDSVIFCSFRRYLVWGSYFEKNVLSGGLISSMTRLHFSFVVLCAAAISSCMHVCILVVCSILCVRVPFLLSSSLASLVSPSSQPLVALLVPL